MTKEEKAKLEFEISYWPEQPGDPAFWFGFTDKIEADTIEEASRIMYEKYGDCHPYLSPLNDAAKKAEAEYYAQQFIEYEPLPF